MSWLSHRRRQARKLISRLPIKPGLWLDVGAGEGEDSLPLFEVGCKVIAYDIDVGSLGEIRRIERKVPVVRGDYHYLPFNDSKFDGVFMGFAAHYSKDFILLFEEIFRVLKSAGVLLVAEYNRKQPLPWVPRPLPLNRITQLLLNSGFIKVESILQNQRIYVIRAERK